MARPLVIAVTAALAGSVALNVYQWRHGEKESEAATGSEGRVAGSGERATGGGGRETGSGGQAAGEKQARPAGAPAPMAATCQGQLVSLSDKLSSAEQKLEERLTFEEKFERSPPAPESETKLEPLVSKVFEKAPDGYSFDLECRGEICNVVVTAPETGNFDWWETLQTDVYHKEGRGHSVRGGTPSHDPVTKAALLVTKTQVMLNGADTADGIPVLQAVVAQLRESGAVARCAAQDASPGYVSLQLWLDGAAGKITYEVGGTLASSAGGRCVLVALDQAIAGATVPPRTRTAVLYHTIEIPPA